MTPKRNGPIYCLSQIPSQSGAPPRPTLHQGSGFIPPLARRPFPFLAYDKGIISGSDLTKTLRLNLIEKCGLNTVALALAP